MGCVKLRSLEEEKEGTLRKERLPLVIRQPLRKKPVTRNMKGCTISDHKLVPCISPPLYGPTRRNWTSPSHEYYGTGCLPQTVEMKSGREKGTAKCLCRYTSPYPHVICDETIYAVRSTNMGWIAVVGLLVDVSSALLSSLSFGLDTTFSVSRMQLETHPKQDLGNTC